MLCHPSVGNCRPPRPLPAGLCQLAELELQGCYGISGEGLRHLGTLLALQALNLAQCGGIAGGLGHLLGARRTCTSCAHVCAYNIRVCAQKWISPESVPVSVFLVWSLF